ncbi:BA75_04470T0 [Komagataella pastoris]|uniref:BA75_04470T0 n=1 Tax=Komagataella pastoris TaxID=4922 RepID=A0A1B2JI14_PICPA|nr:BA75_04470T0 [Komagataella pastoris]
MSTQRTLESQSITSGDYVSAEESIRTASVTDFEDALEGSHSNLPDDDGTETLQGDKTVNGDTESNTDHEPSNDSETTTEDVESGKRTIENTPLQPSRSNDEELDYHGSEEKGFFGNINDFSQIASRSRTNNLRLTRTETQGFHDELSRVITSASRKKITEEEEGAVDPSTLDWDSPDDPDNPTNWSPRKKWFSTMTVAFLCLVVSLGSSLYVCGVPDLMLEMGISQELGFAGLSLYLLGLSVGPIIAAPLSELIGRRPIYIVTLPLSMLFTMGVGLSPNIWTILVLRFFSGASASPCLAVASGSIVDVFLPNDVGLAMALFCLAPFMGPVLGPIIGGFVAENKGWKWTLWVNLMFAGALLPFVLMLPETYAPVILKKRAKSRQIKLQKPQVGLLKFLMIMLSITLVKPLQMLVVEPIVIVFSIYISFVFAILFGFFEAYPVIFRGVYRMSLGISGLTFIGIGVGLFLGTIFYLLLNARCFYKKHDDGFVGMKDKDGNPLPPTPESRLLSGKYGALALPVSLFWLAWTSRESIHWIVPVLAGVPFGFSLILIFFTVVTYFSMSYPPLSLASALAANNLARYTIAAAFPLFTVQMYDKLGIDWATSLFAFVAIGLVPVPWIFEYYGESLRKRSKFGFDAEQKEDSSMA